MSARINQIDAAGNFHVFNVELLNEHCYGKAEVFKLPQTEVTGRLQKGDIVTYYYAEDFAGSAIGEDGKIFWPRESRGEERVVLLFKCASDEENFPRPEERVLWLDKGERLLTLDHLPRLVEILLEVSPYYDRRRSAVEKSLDVLELSQDPETIDALFSIRPEKLDVLLGGKDMLFAVQIADALLYLASLGADFEHPRRRELRQILSLAVFHGTPEKAVREYIDSYYRELS